jgi:hypothetical protein
LFLAKSPRHEPGDRGILVSDFGLRNSFGFRHSGFGFRLYLAVSVTSNSPFSFVDTVNTGKSRRAGPSVTLPSGEKVEPWHAANSALSRVCQLLTLVCECFLS